MPLQLIYCTLSNELEAKALAKHLLDLKLIACANIFPAHTALYNWEGAVQEEAEVAMLMKAPEHLFSAIEAAIKEKHSYDTPCIVTLDAEKVHEPFACWVRDQCQ